MWHVGKFGTEKEKRGRENQRGKEKAAVLFNGKWRFHLQHQCALSVVVMCECKLHRASRLCIYRRIWRQTVLPLNYTAALSCCLTMHTNTHIHTLNQTHHTCHEADWIYTASIIQLHVYIPKHTQTHAKTHTHSTQSSQHIVFEELFWHKLLKDTEGSRK